MFGKIVIGALLLFIAACSKKQDGTPTNNGIIGRWKLTESFMSPGGPGTWSQVPPQQQFSVQFQENGTFSHSPNFFAAESRFDRYERSGNRLLLWSTVTSETADWLVNAVDGKQLNITFNTGAICIEGCASRFRAVF